jgi:COP9 signalosome complex subunit 6
VIANLTTRLNAVKTLESRIRLLKSYLQSLPASFLDSSDSTGTVKASEAVYSTLSHPILRSISSLISDLSLLTPQDSRSFAIESLAQENDVALVSLLGQLGENVQLMRELGKKSAIVEASKQSGMSSTSGRKSQFTLQSRFEEHEIRDPGAMQL